MRRVLCAGSENIERDLPDVTNADAVAGSQLHALVANPNLDRLKLTEQDKQTLEAAEQMLRDFRSSVLLAGDTTGADGFDAEVCEHEFCLFDGTPSEMRNHPDWVAISIDRGVVACADYKFGRVGAPTAADNWQLLIYLLSIREQLASRKIRNMPTKYFGAMIQPWLSSRVEPVEYSEPQMLSAEMQVRQVMDAAKLPDAQRTPGFDQCKFCKGRLHGVCPEQRAMSLELTTDPGAVESALENPRRFLETMDADKRTRLLDALEFVDDLRDKLRQAAREMLADNPASVPLYKLGKTGEMRKLTDIIGLRDRLRDKGVTFDQFVRQTTISMSAVESLVREATKAKGKGLDEIVTETLSGLVDVIPRAAPLKRVGYKEATGSAMPGSLE